MGLFSKNAKATPAQADVKEAAKGVAQDVKDNISKDANNAKEDKTYRDNVVENESNYTYTVKFDEKE